MYTIRQNAARMEVCSPTSPPVNPPLEIVEEGVDFKELEEGCFFRDVDIYKGDMVGFGSLL